MNNAVIGIGFGDEGKGCTVSMLCNFFPSSLVIRYSGGHQAGHHVVYKNKKHVFSNFGSGTLQGRPTYWSERCTIDPVGIINEYIALRDINITPVLYINENCPVTTPADKLANTNNAETKKHGTCGVGFFETLKRQKAGCSFTAKDLIDYTTANSKQRDVEKYHSIINNVRQETEFLHSTILMRCAENIHIVSKPPEYKHKIYESSQGLLLDQDIGFFPHVTPSSVGEKYFTEEQITIDKRYFVTRAYQTRHGNGPMTNHGELEFAPKIEFDATNKPNENQKAMRASILDLTLLEYGLKQNGKIRKSDTLVITCLEHLASYSFYRNGLVASFDSKELFCSSIANSLGFSSAIMCSNHVFTPISLD